MDIPTFTTILSSVKTASEIAKLLKESDLSLEKAEIKLKLADLIGALADVKMQLADVRELLIDKDEEIKKLQDEIKVKGNLVFEMTYYWLETEKGIEGPFCQVCYDKDKNLVRLHNHGAESWVCRVCSKLFDKKIS